LTAYLDASALAPMLTLEPTLTAIAGFMKTRPAPLHVSEFAVAEVGSVMSRLVRMGALSASEASDRLSAFDAWRGAEAQSADVHASDVRACTAIVRRFELMLKAPDALHLAICLRLGARLVTLDHRLARAAQVLDVPVELIALE